MSVIWFHWIKWSVFANMRPLNSCCAISRENINLRPALPSATLENLNNNSPGFMVGNILHLIHATVELLLHCKLLNVIPYQSWADTPQMWLPANVHLQTLHLQSLLSNLPPDHVLAGRVGTFSLFTLGHFQSLRLSEEDHNRIYLVTRFAPRGFVRDS